MKSESREASFANDAACLSLFHSREAIRRPDNTVSLLVDAARMTLEPLGLGS